jgi:hypothetical protein
MIPAVEEVEITPWRHASGVTRHVRVLVDPSFLAKERVAGPDFHERCQMKSGHLIRHDWRTLE